MKIYTLKRPMINITDKWEAHIKDSIDPRLFVMVPAFKTEADNKPSQ